MKALDEKAADPALWNDQAAASAVMAERAKLQAQVGEAAGFAARLSDARELLALSADDQAMRAGAEDEVRKLWTDGQMLRISAMFTEDADGNDAFLEVHAGAGGTEAQDWTQMLLRMYTRWAERKGFAVSLIEETEGEEAGLKSATLKIQGANAYGLLKSESGVHRLVRISPFDSSARRHTSFASAWVYPVVDDSIKIDIAESDCRIDTYRASGAGGQHVNKTDSAVRITHRPSGIVVSCQSERSQLQNREAAWKMLRARMYEAELQRRRAATQAANDAKSDIGWGHQIRSYVLQPYQMVKDLRFDAETSDTRGVLDGDIDNFLFAALTQTAKV
ncbi:peptide chain release factor 2 [Alphaproteobacteria bacterium]|nr:peptide chain release factor 2 [Alphaproteobacteria bacterium]